MSDEAVELIQVPLPNTPAAKAVRGLSVRCEQGRDIFEVEFDIVGMQTTRQWTLSPPAAAVLLRELRSGLETYLGVTMDELGRSRHTL